MTQADSGSISVFDGLDDSLGEAADMTAAFAAELSNMQRGMARAGRESASLQQSFGRDLHRAIRGVIVDGNGLSATLQNVASSMLGATLDAAMKPVSSQLGSALAKGVSGLMGFSNGAGFAQGRVMPFASGGVVSGPVKFPMRGGTGLMGEAGPEAIMPLTRGADGKLGVRAQSGGAVHVVMNISTPNAEGFRRSRTQIASQLSRAIGRGQRSH